MLFLDVLMREVSRAGAYLMRGFPVSSRFHILRFLRLRCYEGLLSTPHPRTLITFYIWPCGRGPSLF